MHESYKVDRNSGDQAIINAIVHAIKEHLSNKYTIDRFDGSKNQRAIVIKINQDHRASLQMQSQVKSEIIGHINSIFDHIKIRKDIRPETEETDEISIKGDPLAKIYDLLIKGGYIEDPNQSVASSSATTLPKRSQSSSRCLAASSTDEQQAHKRKTEADRSAKQVKKVPEVNQAEINFEVDVMDIIVQAFVDFRRQGNMINPNNHNRNNKYKIIISIPKSENDAMKKTEIKKSFIQRLNQALDGVTSLSVQKQRDNYPGGRPVDEPDDEIWLGAKAITSIYAHLQNKIETRLISQSQSALPATSPSSVASSSAKAAAAVGLFKAAPSSAAASSSAQPSRPLSIASPYIRELQEKYDALTQSNEELERENAFLRSIEEEALQLQQQIDAARKLGEQLEAEEASLRQALKITGTDQVMTDVTMRP